MLYIYAKHFKHLHVYFFVKLGSNIFKILSNNLATPSANYCGTNIKPIGQHHPRNIVAPLWQPNVAIKTLAEKRSFEDKIYLIKNINTIE